MRGRSTAHAIGLTRQTGCTTLLGLCTALSSSLTEGSILLLILTIGSYQAFAIGSQPKVSELVALKLGSYFCAIC